MSSATKDELTSLRCPGERPHDKYELCGHLLGALSGQTVILYCDVCKQFYEISEISDNGNIVLKPINKSTRLKLINKLRVVE